MRRPNSPPPELLNCRVRFAATDVNSTLVAIDGTMVTGIFLRFSVTFRDWNSFSFPWSLVTAVINRPGITIDDCCWRP
jgi:hypothetical protein